MANIDRKDIYQEVADVLFSRFVVNHSAVAVQNENGKYMTIKTPLTVEMIKAMLRGGFSIGTYQQQYNNDKLRWICFDFDVKKKSENDSELNDLKNLYIIPFLLKLENKDISYLVEYSGRRGFHIWIFFNQIISKNLAYTIIKSLIGETEGKIKNSKEYGLDLFPKTCSGRMPNKYGLQVKLPLSRHRVSGTYSYFIRNIDEFNNDKRYHLDDVFLTEQISIIEDVKDNDINDILQKCGLESEELKEEIVDYHKQYIIMSKKMDLAEIRKAFNADPALSAIWKHVENGMLDSFERTMLLGVFGHMNCGMNILTDIFKLQNNYNRRITRKMIMKYRDTMFPITFKYLYRYLGIEGCLAGKENVYIDDYLVDFLGIPSKKHSGIGIKKNVNFAREIVEKELNYFFYNEEVYDFEIVNSLKTMTYYDFSNIELYINKVEEGKEKRLDNISFKKYIRKEETKERIMISLGAKERVITTALITKLIMYCQKDYRSYSYHLNLGPEGDVFYPWVSSWIKYKNDITQYFSVPFFENYYCLKIDFKHFYDSIFLHSAFERICNRDSIVDKVKFINIYKYLLEFNEMLMRKVGLEARGVPQGPAYARVMAEITLDEMVNQFFEENQRFNTVRFYRYVDDIFVFGEEGEMLERFLEAFSAFFENIDLFLNKTKSKNYGCIKDLLPRDKEELKEFREFNYDIFQLKDSAFLDEYGKDMFDTKYLRFIYRKQGWDINDANLIFSERIDKSVKDKYLEEFYNDLIKSKLGRGSMFRKIYLYLFNEPKYLYAFFCNKDYMEVPENTINQYNMISCMILCADKILNTITEKSILELEKYILGLKDDNAMILYRYLHREDKDESC